MLLPSKSSWSFTSMSFFTATPSHMGIRRTIFSPRKLRMDSSLPPSSAFALMGKCAYTSRILYLHDGWHCVRAEAEELIRKQAMLCTAW